MTAAAIRAAILAGRWAMTQHARRRAGTWRVSDEDAGHALANGEILEDYPDDPRGASALVLGHAPDGRPLHGVCAFDPSGTVVIITIYEPNPPKWVDERTREEKDEGS